MIERRKSIGRFRLARGVGVVLAGWAVCIFASPGSAAVEFARDIRPILSDNCFACHGPDAKHRKADLRLDTEAGLLAVRPGDSPRPAAVVPGKPDQSLLFQRITHADPDKRMPHKSSGKKLSPAQIGLIKRWIEEGATWQGHWAFITPTRPKLPDVGNDPWVRTQIDRFVLARLKAKGVQPKDEAERRALIRRVTFDLTGMPPTVREVEAFVNDKSADAYEKVVDRLLASPRFGEHMTRYWLDLARYGDTHGLHLDNYREMWPYRDWVINAFNANKRYDRFVIEQLAGDLLPNATLDDKVASGFNRAHVTTAEGGSIKEEVYVRNVVDRVSTTATVFMGLTAGCAVCHDHKFDPLTMRDYYGLFAYFNSLDGNPMDGNRKDPAPVERVPTAEQKQRIKTLNAQLAQVDADIRGKVAQVKYVEPVAPSEAEPPKPVEVVWIDDAAPGGANLQGNTPWQWVTKDKHPVFSGNRATRRQAKGLSQHFFDGAKSPLRVGKGDKLFAYVYLDPKDPPKEIMLQWNSGQWMHRAYWGQNVIPWGADNSTQRRPMGKLPKAGEWVRLEVDAQHVGLNPGALINGWAFTQHDGTVYWDKAGIVTMTDQKPAFDSLKRWVVYERSLPKPSMAASHAAVAAIVKLDDAKLNDAQRKQLTGYFIEYVYSGSRETFEPLHKRQADLKRQVTDIEKSYATTLVFKELAKPRDAFILKRGEYDQRGDKVGRATPEFLPPMAEGLPNNRLGFAKWLVDPSHPLTARVAVNRYWQQLFGVGLVKTSEDFGSQGEPPSHPQLLDWLAVDFRESGWDVKRMMKQLVMSATYRQSAKATPAQYKADPENRMLARGPRFRLDAEMLRDQALAVADLLVEKIGGPSVKPPQPDGLWFAVGYSGSNTVRFKADTDDKIYRRSVYTFWKRTSPPPQMTAFDARSREECTPRRERTNTAMQALLLMNEPQYFEAGRRLAEAAMRSGNNPKARVAFMIQKALKRPATARDFDDLLGDHAFFQSVYLKDPESAKALIAVGESKPDASLNPGELAALTMVASTIMNSDEFVTKP